MSDDKDKLDTFEHRTRELLREDAAQLDARIRSRLTQARFAAVAEARKARGTFAWRTWIPAGSLAGVAAIALLLWNGMHSPSNAPVIAEARSPLDDLEIVAADENLDMIEDVEFYAWLDTQSGVS